MLTAPVPPELWRTKDHMQSHKANFWKLDIPTPQSTILNEKLRPFIEKYLATVLALFGMDDASVKRFITFAIQAAKKEQDDTLVAYERELKAGLIAKTIPHMEDDALNRRADIIYGEIKDHLTGDTMLDIGCGNGLISSLARKHFKDIILLDVVKYLPAALNLPFKLYVEGQALEVDKPADTVLLLTVLHHSCNPVELLKLAWGVTKRRLIIIESVVGVHMANNKAKYDLLDFSDEDQIAFAAFIDWFYNRVLHDNIPVPYNFTTVEKWISLFLQLNMPLVKTQYLGQDIDIGPEYHVLFILEKPASA
jgi:ubiquinone/menaquinone biosynthesis C-methylase UbiE